MIDDTVTVLLAFDAAYAQHGAACIASLLRHTPGKLDILIVSAGDPAPFADRIRHSFAAEPRASIDIRRFTVPGGTHFPLPSGLTLETYLRFWIGDLFPGRRRAIYIDPDTVATSSILPLWRTDLRGNTIGAVPIPGSTRPAEHGMPPGSPFFNAGVLLLDLEAWRTRDYRDRCLGILAARPEAALDGDQDILNLAAIGDWLPLDYEWNVISPFYRRSHPLGLSEARIEEVKAGARIVHYNGVNKPWRYMDDHPRKADYLEALQRTEWRDSRPADRTALNRVRKAVQRVVPNQVLRALRQIGVAVGM